MFCKLSCMCFSCSGDPPPNFLRYLRGAANGRLRGDLQQHGDSDLEAKGGFLTIIIPLDTQNPPVISGEDRCERNLEINLLRRFFGGFKHLLTMFFGCL